MAKEKLEQHFGLLWPMVKPLIAGVRLKFDAERRCLIISRGDKQHSISFDEIEESINVK